MDLSRGYRLPPSDGRQVTLLDWITDRGGAAPGEVVLLGPLFLEHPDAVSAFAKTFSTMEEGGLIEIKTGDPRGWTCTVTAAGLALIEELERRRADPIQRRRAARDAVLRWLYDNSLHSRDYDSFQFIGSSFDGYYTKLFTQQDYEAAIAWLEDEGYASIEGGSFAKEVRITARGERAIESGGTISDDSSLGL